ncbi:carbonate dehydratase [Fictibacillus enclensis]|uniref:carbonate dehydratase n=1 Tax=Fictibacillus enclensis TaxID=1017270 RepID=UPI0024C0BC27|nr:carbonate dehydratase [Fictibacillus enclensis]WHY70608.1 carbonate dehydratase [Fictibacillus enclensis]
MKHSEESSSCHQKDTDCCFKPFISPNPKTSFNPIQISPKIDKSAFISPFTSVIGDVAIRRNVYVAPLVSIRADEGTPFHIGSNTNLQDGVILHGLLNRSVKVDGKEYSIFIDKKVSVAHGALIHGPCFIGKNVFVGFKTIVYDATVEDGVFIAYNAVVTNGVHVRRNRFVPPGAYIDTQKKADALSRVPTDAREFAREVQRVNQEFPPAYHLLFGDSRCSCGMAYNKQSSEKEES